MMKKRINPISYLTFRNEKAVCSLRYYPSRYIKQYMAEEQSTTLEFDSTKKTKTITNKGQSSSSMKKHLINKPNQTVDILHSFSLLNKSSMKMIKIDPRPSIAKLSVNKSHANNNNTNTLQIKKQFLIKKKTIANRINEKQIKLKTEIIDSLDQSAIDRKISDRTLKKTIKNAVMNYIEYDLPDISNYPSIQSKLSNYSYMNELNHQPIIKNHIRLRKDRNNNILNEESYSYNKKTKEVCSLNNTLACSKNRLSKLLVAKKEYEKIEKEIPQEVKSEIDLISRQYLEHSRNKPYKVQSTKSKIKSIILNSELWERRTYV